MAVFTHNKHGVVNMVWNDVADISAFNFKYGTAKGLVEGEAKIGQLWDGKTLTNPPVPAASTDPRDYPLTRTQFLIFMANGYDDALAIIMPTLKTVDVALWAKTKNDAETAPLFHFAGILGLLANPAFAGLIPKGLDVTEATLSKQWMLAKNY